MLLLPWLYYIANLARSCLRCRVQTHLVNQERLILDHLPFTVMFYITRLLALFGVCDEHLAHEIFVSQVVIILTHAFLLHLPL